MTNSRLNLRNLYLYLVCLITLIIFIVSSIQAVDNLMDVVLVNDGYYETYEIYKERYVTRNPETGNTLEKSEEEIREEYEEFIQNQKKIQRNINIKRFATSVFALLISGGFWVYHWRKIQEERG